MIFWPLIHIKFYNTLWIKLLQNSMWRRPDNRSTFGVHVTIRNSGDAYTESQDTGLFPPARLCFVRRLIRTFNVLLYNLNSFLQLSFSDVACPRLVIHCDAQICLAHHLFLDKESILPFYILSPRPSQRQIRLLSSGPFLRRMSG